MRRILLAAASLVTAGCTSYFFYPMAEHVTDLTQLGIEYEDVFIGDEPRLHAWYLPAPEPRGTVLFLHGNAENISTHTGSVYWLPRHGYNVLALDYRGYGRSTGTPTLAGLVDDVGAATRYLRGRTGSCVHLFGQSLGGALALYAAGGDLRGSYCSVVTESAFTGYRAMARHVLGRVWIPPPLSHLLALTVAGGFDALDAVGHISPTALVLIHGDQDSIVPVDHAAKLFAAARQPKELWIVHGADHIGALRSEENRVRFVQLLDRAAQQVLRCGSIDDGNDIAAQRRD